MSECPYSGMGASGVPRAPTTADLTYGDYLKISELLKLQVPQSDPAHHDEMLFIIIHQSYEIWFKLILLELENSMKFMDEGKVLRANHFVSRVVAILKVLVQQIHLLETMEPVEFLEFRDRLMPASGFQSLQFREVEFLCGLKDERYFGYFKDRPEMSAGLKKRFEGRDLREAYYGLLSKLGFDVPASASELERKAGSSENPTSERSSEQARERTIEALRKIYQDPDAHMAIYLLSESLLELDETLGFWRSHHVTVVERIIGHKAGTGGSAGVDYLRSTLSKKCFPLLWEVRTRLKKRT